MMSKNTLLPVQSTLQSKGRLLDLSRPIVMGILNATPDSFFTKDSLATPGVLLHTAERMLKDGAAILDIGGVTTKPGAGISDPQTELSRVIHLISDVHERFPDAWISVDTYHAAVAKEAVAAGASIVNDVSSGILDNDMLASVAELKVPYIAMHMQGTPATMQIDPQYDDVVYEVRDHLRQVCDHGAAAGITDIIIDPGFGFGKTVPHNFTLLRGLHTFRMLGRPILAGLSRKSMICKTLKVNPEHALNGTTALHMIALQQGASILRVHDVKEAVETISLHEAFMH
jgi:dihydropteroate synthase